VLQNFSQSTRASLVDNHRKVGMHGSRNFSFENFRQRIFFSLSFETTGLSINRRSSRDAVSAWLTIISPWRRFPVSPARGQAHERRGISMCDSALSPLILWYFLKNFIPRFFFAVLRPAIRRESFPAALMARSAT